MKEKADPWRMLNEGQSQVGLTTSQRKVGAVPTGVGAKKL